MHVFIGLAFLAIIVSLAFAFFYLMRDKGTSNKTVNALTLRVGLSIALLAFVLFANYMGWIHSTGFRP